MIPIMQMLSFAKEIIYFIPFENNFFKIYHIFSLPTDVILQTISLHCTATLRYCTLRKCFSFRKKLFMEIFVKFIINKSIFSFKGFFCSKTFMLFFCFVFSGVFNLYLYIILDFKGS